MTGAGRGGGRRPALPGRRLQAVDLPLPGGRPRALPPVPRPRPRRRPAQPDRELPERAGHPPLRQRPVRRHLHRGRLGPQARRRGIEDDEADRPPSCSPGAPPPGPAGATSPAGPTSTARRGDEARRLARYLADRLGRRAGRSATRDAARPPAPMRATWRSSSGRCPTRRLYEAALVAEGLDFHVVGGSGFFAQLEVLDLINVLSAVEDPTDAVALAGALRSPFFSISDDALFWLASSARGRSTRGSRSWPATSRPPPRRRSAPGRAGPAALLDLARGQGRGPDRRPGRPDPGRLRLRGRAPGRVLGDRKRANARKLVRMARRLDDAGGFILADFVERLRSDLRAATKETQAATTDDGGQIVRLMSIHQSKGLEFPIVVVPDLDRKRPGELRRVAFDADLGPLVNPVADADDGSDDAEPTARREPRLVGLPPPRRRGRRRRGAPPLLRRHHPGPRLPHPLGRHRPDPDRRLTRAEPARPPVRPGSGPGLASRPTAIRPPRRGDPAGARLGGPGRRARATAASRLSSKSPR